MNNYMMVHDLQLGTFLYRYDAGWFCVAKMTCAPTEAQAIADDLGAEWRNLDNTPWLGFPAPLPY